MQFDQMNLNIPYHLIKSSYELNKKYNVTQPLDLQATRSWGACSQSVVCKSWGRASVPATTVSYLLVSP